MIILDEPFANLDPTTQIRLKKIIKELSDNPEVTILVSSHDLGSKNGSSLIPMSYSMSGRSRV